MKFNETSQIKFDDGEHNDGTSQIKFDEHYQNWVRKTTHELQHNKCITDVVMKKLSEKAREISKLYDTETGDIKDGLSILRILACLLQHQKTT